MIKANLNWFAIELFCGRQNILGNLLVVLVSSYYKDNTAVISKKAAPGQQKSWDVISFWSIFDIFVKIFDCHCVVYVCNCILVQL